MRPYYEDDAVRLFHGDCLEVMPTLAFDVLVTDPPYGIAWRRGVNRARASKAHSGILNDQDTTARDKALALAAAAPGVVFGSFYAPFPANLKQVLVWHKPADAGLVGSVTGFRRDAEPIFLVGPWPTLTAKRSSVLPSTGGIAATVTATGHPHTKPTALMSLLIDCCPPGIVIDPFAGSGTTLVAAKRLGRRSIGIELDEAYCETAAKRLRQACLFSDAA